MKTKDLPVLKQKVLDMLPTTQAEMWKKLGIPNRDGSSLVNIMLKENLITRKKQDKSFLLERSNGNGNKKLIKEELKIKFDDLEITTEDKLKLKKAEKEIKLGSEDNHNEEELKKKAKDEEKLRLKAEEELKKKAKDEEKLRLKAEEELKKKAKDEEKLRLKAEEEEKLRLKAEEDEKLRLKAEEEEKLRLKAEEDEKLRLKAEEEEKLRLKAEEELKKKAKEEELKKKPNIENIEKKSSRYTGDVKQKALEILPITQSEMWKVLGITSSACARLVDTMLKENLITRRKLNNTFIIEKVTKDKKEKIMDFSALISSKKRFSPCCGCTLECDAGSCHLLSDWILE